MVFIFKVPRSHTDMANISRFGKGFHLVCQINVHSKPTEND